jgi:hypothetical protein
MVQFQTEIRRRNRSVWESINIQLAKSSFKFKIKLKINTNKSRTSCQTSDLL